jgi:hypothetical protein
LGSTAGGGGGPRLRRLAETTMYQHSQQAFTLLLRATALQGAAAAVAQPFLLLSDHPVLAQLEPEALSLLLHAHFRALFDLLERDWGALATVYLCGGEYHAWAVTALAAKPYRLRCHVALHELDAKLVAAALAEDGCHAAYWCPCDAWTLLFGRVGRGVFRECDEADDDDGGGGEAAPLGKAGDVRGGMWPHYRPLVDVAATSLAFLASARPADGAAQLTRVAPLPLEHVEDPSDLPYGPEAWVGVEPPLTFDHFKNN